MSSHYNPVTIAESAISGSDNYCYGYGNRDTNGYYITTVKLEAAKVSISGLGKDEVLEGIVAYDRAEKSGTYLGQVNVITVSSFAGPNSAIWGYDIAKTIHLRSKLLYELPVPNTKRKIPVYSMDHLLKATEALFGTEKNRHYPPLAGAHVPCACLYANSKDRSTGKLTSGWIWCFLALAIAEHRESDACLFIEDAGFFADTFSYGKVLMLTKDEVVAQLDKKTKAVTYSQILCGYDQSAPFKEIFVSYRYVRIDKDCYGTALACAPYVTLARNVYPPGGAQQLVDMTLEDWKERQLR